MWFFFYYFLIFIFVWSKEWFVVTEEFLVAFIFLCITGFGLFFFEKDVYFGLKHIEQEWVGHLTSRVNICVLECNSVKIWQLLLDYSVKLLVQIRKFKVGGLHIMEKSLFDAYFSCFSEVFFFIFFFKEQILVRIFSQWVLDL